jgi:hypothetical protein
MPVIPARVRKKKKRRMNFQTGLGKNQNPVSKIPRAKRTGDVAQVGEHLLSKAKAVSSSPSTSKKKKDWPRLEVGTVTPSSPGPAYNCNPSTPEVSGIPLSQICFMDYKRISRDFQFIQFQGYLFF